MYAMVHIVDYYFYIVAKFEVYTNYSQSAATHTLGHI